MKSTIVYSGYVRCKTCKKVIAKGHHGACVECKRRVFEYGVLNGDTFMSYQKLKERVHLGQAFRDGANSYLPITSRTFGAERVVKRNRRLK